MRTIELWLPEPIIISYYLQDHMVTLPFCFSRNYAVALVTAIQIEFLELLCRNSTRKVILYCGKHDNTTCWLACPQRVEMVRLWGAKEKTVGNEDKLHRLEVSVL